MILGGGLMMGGEKWKIGHENWKVNLLNPFSFVLPKKIFIFTTQPIIP